MNTKWKRRLFILGGMLSAVVFSSAAMAQQTIRLTFASGYPPTFLFVQEMQRNFAEEMNRELAKNGNRYRIEWNFALSGTLAKIPGMLEAMETGQAEFGHVSHLFAPGKLPLQNIDAFAPFTTPDHRIGAKVSEALMKNVPAIKQQFEKIGLVHLSDFALDDYVLVSKTPISAVSDLRGKKVGGAGPNLNWLQGTGAVGVTTTGAQAYTDLKNGVFDALLSPLTFVVNGKYHEVGRYVVRVRFNSLNGGQIVANKAAFDKLPPDVQTAAHTAAATFRTRYSQAVDKAIADAEKSITSGGGIFSDLPNSERAKWVFGLPISLRTGRAILIQRGAQVPPLLKALCLQ